MKVVAVLKYDSGITNVRVIEEDTMDEVVHEIMSDSIMIFGLNSTIQGNVDIDIHIIDDTHKDAITKMFEDKCKESLNALTAVEKDNFLRQKKQKVKRLSEELKQVNNDIESMENPKKRFKWF